ncbi:MAG: hypothetical protein KUG79_01560 [Pseudomonadales bacterium]|nr:hypothetical protein [Pseudomonadales bacterium]
MVKTPRKVNIRQKQSVALSNASINTVTKNNAKIKPRAASKSQTARPDLPMSDDDGKVKKLVLDALRIIRSDHFEDYFDLFTQDAIWMMPSAITDVDLNAARKFYGFTENFWFDQQTSIDELMVSGDMAYVRVSFDGYLRPKRNSADQPLRSISRHIWILKRQLDGQWKISRDIWNNPK